MILDSLEDRAASAAWRLRWLWWQARRQRWRSPRSRAVARPVGTRRSRGYWRLFRTVLVNASRYLVVSALRNWVRNLGSTAPALGSMTLLLAMGGLIGLLGVGLANLAQSQAHQASVIHVYLRDDASQVDVADLAARLGRDRRVVSVRLVSKEEALRRAQRRPGLSELVGADANPFPASLEVQVDRIEDVAAVDGWVRHEDVVDPVIPTSYDANAFRRVQEFLFGVAVAGSVFLGLLGFVAVTVTVNSVRAAILTRREELAIMQLVGAPRWMVRTPFLIEGVFTGGLAGVVGGLVTLAVTATAIGVGSAGFAQLAPGVTAQLAWLAAALVVVTGVLLGSGSSLLSVQRHLRV